MTHLARQLASSEVTSRPRVVQHGDHRLEVLMDTPATDAPEGWRAEGDGFLWVWEASEPPGPPTGDCAAPLLATLGQPDRSEEHTSELQSLMHISYAVFCLKKKTNKKTRNYSRI